jgi:hypothetical protein
MTLRVLISGGRDYKDYQKIYDALVAHGGADKIGVVIHGGARGADTLAEIACQSLKIPTWPFPISEEDWRTKGYAAGPLRNQQMLDEAAPEILLAFPGPDSRGTWDMVRRTLDAGLPVRLYEGDNIWTENEIHRSGKGHGKRT